jgi:hypothetical protein
MTRNDAACPLSTIRQAPVNVALPPDPVVA